MDARIAASAALVVLVGCGGEGKECPTDTGDTGEEEILDVVEDEVDEDGPSDPDGDGSTECPEGSALNPYVDPPACVECTRSCGLDGETGEVWPTTARSGDCVCTTIDGYYFSLSGPGVSHACDGDGDGWVTESARSNIESFDPAIEENARCEVRRIDRFMLVNDSHLPPVGTEIMLLDTDLGIGLLDLYEPDARDDQALLDADTTYAPAYGSRRLLAEELNSLTKACVSTVADFNADGVADLEEWDLGGDALNAFSYFIELHRGWYEDGRYYIQEKEREADALAGWNLPVTYAADGHWRDCLRLVDSAFSPTGEAVGMDFARYDADPFDAGMAHHSQFKCVQVVEDNPGGDPWRVTTAELTAGRYQYNDCSAMPGTSFPPTGGANPSDALMHCTPADGEVNDVGFVSVEYIHYTDPSGYVRGCVSDCVDDPPACPPSHSECIPLPGEYGRGECACTNHWEGTLCDVCPGNWDPVADCAACVGHWEGLDCETCPEHWLGLRCDVCDSDVDSDGVCDAFDWCNFDGPTPPTLPSSVTGIYTTIYGVSLAGSSNILYPVAPGASIRLSYNYTYAPSGWCCGCRVWIPVGMSGGSDVVRWQSQCNTFLAGSTAPCSTSGVYTTTSPHLTAPTTPGTYYLGFDETWDLCPGGGYGYMPVSRRFAAICVSP